MGVYSAKEKHKIWFWISIILTLYVQLIQISRKCKSLGSQKNTKWKLCQMAWPSLMLG